MKDQMVLLSVGIIVAGGAGLYLLGQSLIDAYFRRKEKFVDNLQDKIGKGGSDGS